MKVRIIREANRYYPQYRRFGIWFYYKYITGSIIDYYNFYSALTFLQEKKDLRQKRKQDKEKQVITEFKI